MIFDLDGLLVDTEIISYHIYKDLVKKEGKSFSKEDYAKKYSGKTEKDNIKNLIETYGLSLSMDEAEKIILSNEKALIDKGVALKTGGLKLLQTARSRSIKIALATSSTKERAIKILSQNDIDHYFDVLVCAEDISNSKPDPEVFLKALDLLGVNKSDALILEDSENGIKAAEAAGIDVICIPDLNPHKEAYLKMTKATLKTLFDVIPYIIS